jgi:transcriptional regulator with XRE-family HTH domain
MPNPTDKHVGSRVRLRRVMLNLTLTDLASRLGVLYQQLQKYERGANRMGASRLQQISHVLQVPVASKARRVLHNHAPGRRNDPCQIT